MICCQWKCAKSETRSRSKRIAQKEKASWVKAILGSGTHDEVVIENGCFIVHCFLRRPNEDANGEGTDRMNRSSR
jgi:hypothetical protein